MDMNNFKGVEVKASIKKELTIQILVAKMQQEVVFITLLVAKLKRFA